MQSAPLFLANPASLGSKRATTASRRVPADTKMGDHAACYRPGALHSSGNSQSRRANTPARLDSVATQDINFAQNLQATEEV